MAAVNRLSSVEELAEGHRRVVQRRPELFLTLVQFVPAGSGGIAGRATACGYWAESDLCSVLNPQQLTIHVYADNDAAAGGAPVEFIHVLLRPGEQGGAVGGEVGVSRPLRHVVFDLHGPDHLTVRFGLQSVSRQAQVAFHLQLVLPAALVAYLVRCRFGFCGRGPSNCWRRHADENRHHAGCGWQ